MADYEAKAWFQQALYDTSRFQVLWRHTGPLLLGEFNHFVQRHLQKRVEKFSVLCFFTGDSDLLLILIIFVQVESDEVGIFSAYPTTETEDDDGLKGYLLLKRGPVTGSRHPVLTNMVETR